MAISDDTTALVAAQLTQAYFLRIGPGMPLGQKTREVEVYDVYARFLGAIKEVPLRPA